MKKLSALLISCLTSILIVSSVYAITNVVITNAYVSDHASDTRFNVMFTNRGDEVANISVKFYLNGQLVDDSKKNIEIEPDDIVTVKSIWKESVEGKNWSVDWSEN